MLSILRRLRGQLPGNGPSGRTISWLAHRPDLYPHIQIYVSPHCSEDESRIQISAGTRIANDREVNDLGYEEGARLPREPWRPPTREESDLLLVSAIPRTVARSVCIVRLPSISNEVREAIARNEEASIRENIVRPL